MPAENLQQPNKSKNKIYTYRDGWRRAVCSQAWRWRILLLLLLLVLFPNGEGKLGHVSRPRFKGFVWFFCVCMEIIHYSRTKVRPLINIQPLFDVRQLMTLLTDANLQITRISYRNSKSIAIRAERYILTASRGLILRWRGDDSSWSGLTWSVNKSTPIFFFCLSTPQTRLISIPKL